MYKVVKLTYLVQILKYLLPANLWIMCVNYFKQIMGSRQRLTTCNGLTPLPSTSRVDGTRYPLDPSRRALSTQSADGFQTTVD